MSEIPSELQSGPFTYTRARQLGVSRRELQGPYMVRIFPRVYRHHRLEMSELDWVAAARMTLPSRARLTGITRIQQLGLDFGPTRPLRFVIEGELHLAPPEIFLHRTKRLPPCDETCVTPAAAFIFYCAQARVIDAIQVGDWLLHHGHMSVEEVRTLALAELWRPGSDEAIWILPHLDERSRSLKESETRALLRFAGIQDLEVNASVDVGGGTTLTADLLHRRCATVVEYEGTQHQEDRQQYVTDIDRYALYRRSEIRYVQATREKLRRPRKFVNEVFDELVAGGYAGPPPEFNHRWASLFLKLSIAIGPREHGRRAVS